MVLLNKIFAKLCSINIGFRIWDLGFGYKVLLFYTNLYQTKSLGNFAAHFVKLCGINVGFGFTASLLMFNHKEHQEDAENTEFFILCALSR